jgi:hypothetical protein
MTDVEPLIRTQLDELMPLPEESRRDWANVLARSRRRQRFSRRRLLFAFAIGVCVLAIAGAAIAAGLGAFSGVTVDQIKACTPSTTALTTPSGARVLTGQTDAGVSCLAYRDPNGGGGNTGGRLGESPAGDVVAMNVLDTVLQSNVIVGLVPAGYTTLKMGSTVIPITNRAFVVDPRLVTTPAQLSGPAGTISIDLRQLAGD